MSYLFKIENNNVYPNEETLLIEPFKSIWERDITSGKNQALRELKYIEFSASKMRSNPYSEYPDDVRKEILMKELFDKKWKEDALIKQAIERIETFQQDGSATYRYWRSACSAAEQVNDFLTTFDLKERTEKNTPVYKPADIISAITKTGDIVKALNAMRESVEQELVESNEKTRANNEVGAFEDPPK
jgi:hypothetical protein